MARGGRRQGTPGKGYANRTDLGVTPDMKQNTAATGGMTAPPPPVSDRQTQQGPSRSPDDSPMLSDPTQRPDEPITAGMAMGAGAGPEVLGMDPRAAETARLKKWLPMLKPLIDDPEMPDSVKMLYRYIRGA